MADTLPPADGSAGTPNIPGNGSNGSANGPADGDGSANGNLPVRVAERIEDLLWNLIPEAGHLRDQVGRIDIANGAKSHPLALTQLLVGYHAVKAAMGVRAY